MALIFKFSDNLREKAEILVSDQNIEKISSAYLANHNV